MKSAADLLHELGIVTRSSAPGRYYARCPQCSHKRKQAHQKLKCLGVTIDNRGVQCGCNHCGWTGGKFYESHNDTRRERGNVVRTPTNRPGDSRKVRDFYR